MFDCIVIGAGTAGCTLAARLTENPNLHVLLIEAGPPDRHRAIRTPLAYPSLFRSTLDWNLWTEPQEHLSNRRLYWPRGRVMGGSGSINAMVHLPGCRADFDAWGVPGWTYDDVLPVFDSLESPPVAAQTVRDPNALTEAFLATCESAGLKRAPFLADASEPKCGLFRANIRKGRRHSAADAFLRPALRRGNLTIWSNVHVSGVKFDSGRAKGVAYVQAGQRGYVEAAREVVLAAGTIGSPHLLMLSGIGPREDLERHRVAVAVPLEGVGKNLQDHLAAPVAHFSTQPVSLSGSNTFLNRWKHRWLGKGPLASNGAEAGALLRSSDELAACDLEIVFAPEHYVDHGFAKPGGHGFSLIPTLLTPASRGTVRLASSDPHEPPLIDPGYLSDPTDLPRLVEGVRKTRRLLEQSAFTPYRGEPVQGRDLDPEEHIRTWGQTLYHPVGSCRMGAGEGAVVDAALRVHGVLGLRVVDASVIPVIPRSHPNAMAMMIALRAARMILGE